MLAMQLAVLPAALLPASRAPAADLPKLVGLPAEVVQDKIRGGLLGQLFGNLNGLPHEFKYNAEPGDVREYTPGLPDGARTDDDTDIEWVYVVEMERAGRIRLPYDRIAELWRTHINRSIWVANAYARELMRLGIQPPLTGSPLLNPRSDFNISGQFVCETFGLICPGMPRTAARTGLHYTRVAIDGEPAQATQFFTSMIATAFLTDDLGRILDAGLAAVDPNSEIREVVAATRRWHGEHADDWRATRRLIKDNYSTRRGGGNGYAVCTACTVAALLYGRGDFQETLRHAFNFGWDADNNAATAGTIVGVLRGRKWMDAQGWKVADRYVNTTRDAMPADETITSFGDRLCKLAERAIVENGGGIEQAFEPPARPGGPIEHGPKTCRIRIQQAANVEPLADPGAQFALVRSRLRAGIEKDLASDDPTAQARGAYLAICLGLDEDLRQKNAAQWDRALAELKKRAAGGKLDLTFRKRQAGGGG